MAIVSDVEIRLRADIARLQQDMDRARQSVTSTMDRITSVAKGAMGALAAIGGVAMFGGFIKSAVDATDAVSDISQRTGVAIKDIAGLQLWFQIGGAEASEFESSMIKLAKTIATNGKAFDKIGVATRDANGALRSNIDVLLDSGDAFAKMSDGTAKTALAIELFGKSGATLIPILNSGSEGLREMTEMADKLGLTFDQKTVDAAGQFNDTLDFMGLATQGVGRKIAAQLLPTLNSLVGSMLDFVVKGDGVRKMADGIGVAFKVLYTAGVGLFTSFSAWGKIIGGTLSFVGNNLATLFTALRQGIEGDYAKAWQTIQNGGKAAGSILSDTFSGVKADLTNAAQTITNVWTGAGGETVAALAATQKASKHITDEERKNAEKLADAYRDLIRSLQERAAASGREAAGLAPLNEAEKDAAKLTQDLADKKLVLTATQEARARSLIEENRANLASIDSQKALVKMQDSMARDAKALADARESTIQTATEEAERNEELARTFGMTAVQVERLELARLREQLAQRSSKGLTLDEIEDLERLIALKERSADALGNVEAMQQTKDFWTDIEKTAHDTFVSIADGGKDTWKRLKDTAKNMFFDWLYQQTLKKWIINVSTVGTSSIGAAANAAGIPGFSGAGAGSAFSLAGAASNLYGALTGGATLAGGLGTGFLGSLAGGLNGAGVGSGLTSALGLNIGNSIAGVIGPNVASGIATGLSGLAAAAPWVAGALAVYTIGKKAFGRGPKEFTGNSTLSGMLGDSFSGSISSDWVKKGGWFRSDKRGSDSSAVSAEMASGLADAYTSMRSAAADYARVLGANADAILARTQTIRIALGKDEAENQKAIADFFIGVGDTIAREIVPSIAQFQREGESASATLQRVAGGFQVVDDALQLIGSNSQRAFNAVGIASIEARERLIQLSGGLDSLAQQTQYFSDNFLTQAERLAPMQRLVTEQLAALGYSSVTTGEQFKAAALALVQSGALATEAGAKTYAGLMALAPAFKTVTDYLEEIRSLNLDSLRTRADAALASLSNSIDNQKEVIADASKSVMTSFGKQIDSVNSSIQRTAELSQSLKGAVIAFNDQAAIDGSRSAARAQIQTALAIAKASGVLPSTDTLRDALSTLGRDPVDQFSTLADYQREVARTNATLQELGGISDTQLSNAEKQLQALEAQRDWAELASERELQRLDGLLESAQLQVDTINGVAASGLSIEAALSAVYTAIRDLGNTSSNSYAYAPSERGNSVIPWDTISPYPQSSTMGENAALLAELRAMNARLAAMEVSNAETATQSGRTADLINSVTGGGNVMLIETA